MREDTSARKKTESPGSQVKGDETLISGTSDGSKKVRRVEE